MRDTPAKWEIAEIDFKEGKLVNALLCQSEGLIAERILDGELLQLADDHLKEALLVALIPSRSTLIVMPLSGDIPFRVANHFYSNSQDALTNWVFCITKAGVAGRVVMENGQFIFDTAIM